MRRCQEFTEIDKMAGKRDAHNLGIELGQAWLPIIVEDEDSVDHACETGSNRGKIQSGIMISKTFNRFCAAQTCQCRGRFNNNPVLELLSELMRRGQSGTEIAAEVQRLWRRLHLSFASGGGT